jgi:hypothetical protein
MFGVNAISCQSVANRRSPVFAVYALRITLYDTNLFVANAPPTNQSSRTFKYLSTAASTENSMAR